MANVFGWLKVAGSKTLHAVELIPSIAITAAKVLFTGEQVAPEIKNAVVTVFESGEAMSVAVLAAVAARGENWAEDTAALAACEQFAKTLAAQFPVFEDAAQKIGAAIEAKVATPAPAA